MKFRPCIVLLLCLSVAIPGSAEEGPDLPAELESIIDGLSSSQREFFFSEDAVDMVGTREKMIKRLKGRSAEEVAAFIDGMMMVIEESKFDPETDLASIPLDTDSEYFNSWRVKRPKSLNPAREPGPFHLSYYAGYQSYYGIRTFAGAPVAVYPEDLIAGGVDVAIVGAPLDMGSYYRGQGFGPQAMRNEYGAGGNDMYTMVNPSRELTIVDYGDIAIDNMSTERTVRHVRER